jgi:hypothetical protein
MLVISQPGPVQDRVWDSPFSRTLIGGDPNLLGSGPLLPYAYKKHTS